MLKKTNFLAIFFLTVATLSQALEATLEISGPSIATIKISLQDLAHMPRLALDVREPHKGEMQHYEGVRLSDLLAKAGVPLGEKLRGRVLATYPRRPSYGWVCSGVFHRRAGPGHDGQ
jgi:hypothetical protein